MDRRTAKNIATLLPKFQVMAANWYQKCRAAALCVVIICGTRTYAEQEAIFAQGRTAPGPKISNARAGSSFHNHGCAFDFVIFPAVNEAGGVGEPLWDSPDMKKAGQIAEGLGMDWGGDWKTFKDVPHIQYTFGKTIAEAKRLHDRGNTVED